MIQQVNRMDFFAQLNNFWNSTLMMILKQKVRFSRKMQQQQQHGRIGVTKVERGTKHNLRKEYHDGKIMRSF